jgi:tetratricopeptide (TPR) repeat protein
MEQQTQTSPKLNFNRIFEYCLLALIFLTPVIFIPSTFISLYSSKLAFLVTVIVVFIAVFLAFTLSRGIIQIPKSKFLIPIAIFPVIALISSFFSGQMISSVAGQLFELGTSGSLLVLLVLLFVAMFAVKEEAKIGVRAIYALFISSGIVVLHLILRIFAASILPVSVASRIPNFLLGGSIDTSILLGAATIASLSALNMLPLGKKVRIAIYALLIASMLFVGAVGFTPVVVAIGLFSLFYFVYTFSWSISPFKSSTLKSEKASFPSLFVLVFSIVLIISNGAISGYLSNTLKINSIEIRPNFTVTMNLVGEAWKKNAALGTGPNMFKEFWDLHRPADINLSQFWATSFSYGSGFVPTIAVTTGVLGLLALLSFLVLYLISGFKAIFSAVGDFGWRYVSLTSFLVSLFLWAMAFVYVPGIATISLAFIFTGIFAATLVPQGVVGSIKINIFSNPKSNFAAVFGIVVLLIASVAGGYFVWERVVAASVYQKGIALLSSGNSQDAKKTISNAIRLVPTDSYWKSFSEASLNRAGVLLNSVSSANNLTDSQKTSIQTEIADAIESAKQAITWNSKNYENWFALGRVYEVLASNVIPGASDSAKINFKEAQSRSPLNPAIPLAFARLAALSGDLAGARENINKAIELKNNYTDAYFALAQLEVASNNIPGAIRSIESVTLMDPQNASLYFQLGLLKYSNQDFGGAVAALGKAIEIVPNYANAQYFLGLSYERLGNRPNAIVQFEALQKTNSDNAEVALILSNLKAGKSPFTNAKPPIDSKPEKRTEPPIQENN